MSKLLKGLTVAAALLWAGSAQAAYVEFTVNLVGVGTFTEDTNTLNPRYWTGQTAGIFKFTIQEGNYGQGSINEAASLSNGVISAQYRDLNSYDQNINSFQAVIDAALFANGAADINGLIIPASSSASIAFNSHYSSRSFTGSVVSIDTKLVDRSQYTYADFASVPFPAVPEPSTWAMMLVGFGAIGAAMRRRPTPVRIPL